MKPIVSVVTRKTVFDLFPGKLISLFKGRQSNPSAVKMMRKMAVFSVAFFIISSFVPFYQFTEGYQTSDEFSMTDFTDQEVNSVLNSIMTEDVFLLKPALNSTQGDRSTANEIFAYQVESGDTLSSIAQRFGIKKETLVMENNLWNANRVRAGKTINILPVDGISHLVKKGDTIEKIAKKYDTEIDVIVRQNQLEEADELFAGTALIIPGAKKSLPVYTASSAPANAAGYHYDGPSTGRLIWPTLKKSSLTQGFRRGHYAIDIGNRNKGPIFASAGGKVIRADNGWNGGYGNIVIIDHGGGMQTLYAHNEKIYVTKGQYVEQGQTIGWMGKSGRVYGPTGIHLHFEVRINGVKYNPINFF